MKVVLIASEKRPGVKETKEELEKKGVKVKIWDIGKEKKIPSGDKFLLLGLGSIDEDIVKKRRVAEEQKERIKLLKKIPKKKMVNRIIPSAKDKQYWVLKLKRIPTLKTSFTKNAEKAIRKKREGKVLKPVEGSLGMGVILPDTPEEAAREEIKLGRLGVLGEPSFFHKIAIQEEVKGNEVIKAIVVGNKVYSVRYVYPEKNRDLTRGKVSVEKEELTEKEKNIIKKIKKKMKTDFIGVDLVRTPKGTKVLELNISPILTKVKKEYPDIYLKLAEVSKKKKESLHEKVLSSLRKRRR